MQEIDFNKLAYGSEAEILFVEAFIASGGAQHANEDGKYKLEFSIDGRDIDWKDFCKRLTLYYSNARRSEVIDVLKSIPAFATLTEVLGDLERAVRYKLAVEMEKKLNLDPGEITDRLCDPT